jgi:hypothetical protein
VIMYSLRNRHCSIAPHDCNHWAKALVCSCIVTVALLVGFILSAAFPHQRTT